MFTAQTKNETETSAGVKPGSVKAATKDSRELYPLWQSLAMRTATVRPKLAVSQPDDPYEQEADRVADRVMRTATLPSVAERLSFNSDNSGRVQRKCDKCEDEEEKKRSEE